MAPSRKDYYEILGVPKTATPEDIRKAYRKLVKEWHPDAYKGEDKKSAEAKFKEIQEAYEVLSDQEKRATFDRFGYVGDPSAYSRGSGRTPGAEGGHFDDIFGDFQDVFDVFFGSNRAGGTARTQGPRAIRGEDIHASVVVDLKDVILGKKVILEYDRSTTCKSCNGNGSEGGTSYKTCPNCNGTGYIKEEHRSFFGIFSNTHACNTCGGSGRIIDKRCPDCGGRGTQKERHQVSVNIPASVENGSTLRIGGHGNAGQNGGPSGDLYVSVRVEMPSEYRRNGNDLYVSKEIDYVEAALGTSIDVGLPEGGSETLKIPAGTSPNTVFRMKNLGVPNISGSKRGDLLVTVRVNIGRPSSREKKLLQQIAKLKNSKVVE